MSMMLAGNRKMRIIGVINSNFPVYAISGSEETEEERRQREERERQPDNSGGSDGGQNNGGDGGSNDSEGGDSGGSNPGRGGDDSETETLRRRLAAADRAKGDLDRELRAIKDKDKSDLERSNAKVEELTQQIAEVTRQRDDAIVRGEILKFPGHDWHDPEAVLSLIDKNAIEIDSEGKVTGVKDAIKKLAESKPYLLRKKESQEDQNKKQQQKPPPPSGVSGSNGAQPDDKNDKRTELVRRYKLQP